TSAPSSSHAHGPPSTSPSYPAAEAASTRSPTLIGSGAGGSRAARLSAAKVWSCALLGYVMRARSATRRSRSTSTCTAARSSSTVLGVVMTPPPAGRTQLPPRRRAGRPPSGRPASRSRGLPTPARRSWCRSLRLPLSGRVRHQEGDELVQRLAGRVCGGLGAAGRVSGLPVADVHGVGVDQLGEVDVVAGPGHVAVSEGQPLVGVG